MGTVWVCLWSLIVSPLRHLDKLSALVKSLFKSPSLVPGLHAFLSLNMRLLKNQSNFLDFHCFSHQIAKGRGTCTSLEIFIPAKVVTST